MDLEQKFPIKVKDVTIASDEYENTLAYIDELKNAHAEKSDKLNKVINFINKLFSLTDVDGYEDCIFDDDAEIWVGVNEMNKRALISIRKSDG